jgi:hypothetical protein
MAVVAKGYTVLPLDFLIHKAIQVLVCLTHLNGVFCFTLYVFN